MDIKIINKGKHALPKYETVGASGLDIRANLIDGSVILNPHETKIIPTGLYVEIPNGYEIQIRGRSGLALKHGIGLANGIGTIDSDYRGEIGVIMINFTNVPYTIHDGDRIAQMICVKYERVNLIEVNSLEKTERGIGGFGHTGK